MTDNYPQLSLFDKNDHKTSKVITCPTEKFEELYNLDVSDYVDTKEGKTSLRYMSYSHAVRLFRMHFEGHEVACELNPLTNGYVFKEIDEGGYFLKPYIYNSFGKTNSYYYGVLNPRNQSVLPGDLDKNDRVVANSQLFNKSYYRAIVKAIALFSGIGLKLWTGEDLSAEMLDELSIEKNRKIEGIRKLAALYQETFGLPYADIDFKNLSHELTLKQINRIGNNLKQIVLEFNANKSSQSEPIQASDKTEEKNVIDVESANITEESTQTQKENTEIKNTEVKQDAE